MAVRRGNALGKIGRVSDAIKEYERAEKLDPRSKIIKKELDALRKAA